MFNFAGIPSITAEQLFEIMNKQEVNVIDVREYEEVMTGMIKGALHIPFGEIPSYLNKLDKSRPLYVICHSGGRGMQVARFLLDNGFIAYNISDGMVAWPGEVF